MTDAALIEVARKLGAAPEDLKALIEFESGWNPRAYNKSGAVGLIQFMPQTLKDYGLLSAQTAALVPTSGIVPEHAKQAVKTEFLSRWPTAEAQLKGPVLTYLSRYAPFPTRQSLYMSVFYPAYRNLAPSTAFPDSVQKANPGVKTISDYVAYVERRRGTIAAVKTGGMAAGALAFAAGAWYLWKA